MELFDKYVSERLGYECYRIQNGFIMWTESKESFHIEELFVSEELRRSHVGSHLIDHVANLAIEARISILSAYIWPHTRGASEVLIAALKTGWKVLSAENGRITVTKKVC